MDSDKDKGMDGPEWVQIAEVAGSLTASVVAGRLDAAGIKVRVTQEALGSRIFPITVGKLGRARIWVLAEDEERSLQILAQEHEEEE